MSFENAYRPYQPQQESSGKAIAALVLSILGFVVCPFFASVLAVTLASMARGDIRQSRGRLGGAGLAQAALILGWIGVAYGLVVSGFFLYVSGFWY